MADGEADVLQEIFDEGEGVALAINLSRRFQAAELQDRLAARFGGSHSGAEVVVDVHLEMAFEFVGEFALAAGVGQEAGESQ